MSVQLFAAIDLGSCDLMMTIYQITNRGEISQIDRIRQGINIGRDTYSDGRISYQSIDQICQILNQFSEIMKGYRITEYRAYAASALREARNQQIVLDQIRVRTGIEVKVQSNSEKRFLCCKAIAVKEDDFPAIISQGTLIADVGSGSTQLLIYDKSRLISAQHIKLGAVRIYELLGSLEGRASMRRLIAELMDYDMRTIQKLFVKDREIKNVIVTGICAAYLTVGRTERTGCISRAEFDQLFAQMVSMSTEEFSHRYSIPEDHAQLLLPAMMIYREFLDMTGADKIWVPGANLCDGIAAEYAQEKKWLKLSHDFTEDILSAARSIAKRYMGSRKHNQSLEKIVLRIFDSMKKYHGLGERERLLAQIAAIVHDCGRYISINDQSYCSYTIIMSTEIIGLSHSERELVANIVRYHTMGDDFTPMIFADHGSQFVVIMTKLIAILRIAVAMDRSNKQKFENLKCTLRDQQLVITTDSMHDITLEQGLFKKNADYFEEVYGIRPVLKRRKEYGRK